MNEHIRKILYKSNYVIGNRFINESARTESDALNKLNKQSISNADSLITQFKTVDTTVNQVLLPAMADAYIESKSIEQVKDIFKSASELIKINKIKNIQSTKNGYLIGDKVYNRFLDLSEYIHELESSLSIVDDKFGKGESINFEEGMKPLWSNDVIAIYDGNNIESCIIYGKGGLVKNKTYKFCIGQYGSSNMWQSYRDNNGASFYYIIDKTKDTNDPFHIVVWMPLIRGGLQLTHEPNQTRDEEKFDSSFAIPKLGMSYRKYLETNGVPVDRILKTIPKTKEEDGIEGILKRSNSSLDWFKSLGKLADKEGLYPELSVGIKTFKMMSSYIGRGHLLSDDQFIYLYKSKDNDAQFQLLKKYVDTGQALPSNQFKILITDNG